MTVTLTYDQRYRRRIRMCDDAGEAFMLDLDRPRLLADGDGLVLAEGGVVRVCAGEEPVIDVPVKTAAEAARLAWHLGNRHTPVQILDDGTLRVRDDPVIAAMLSGLGAGVTCRRASFIPEAGAYAGVARDPRAQMLDHVHER